MPAKISLPKKVSISQCELVEHLPLEAWEVRHLKYGLVSDCKREPLRIPVTLITLQNTRGTKMMIGASPETRNALPISWANALQMAVEATLRSMSSNSHTAHRY